jgi:hypothetical protein
VAGVAERFAATRADIGAAEAVAGDVLPDVFAMPAEADD